MDKQRRASCKTTQTWSPIEGRSIKPTSTCKQHSRIDRPSDRNREICKIEREKTREGAFYFFRSRIYIWRDKRFPVNLRAREIFTSRRDTRYDDPPRRSILNSKKRRALQCGVFRPSSLSSNRVSQILVGKSHLQLSKEKMSQPSALRGEYLSNSSRETHKDDPILNACRESVNAASYTFACSQTRKDNKLHLVKIPITCVFVYSTYIVAAVFRTRRYCWSRTFRRSSEVELNRTSLNLIFSIQTFCFVLGNCLQMSIRI